MIPHMYLHTNPKFVEVNSQKRQLAGWCATYVSHCKFILWFQGSSPYAFSHQVRLVSSLSLFLFLPAVTQVSDTPLRIVIFPIKSRFPIFPISLIRSRYHFRIASIISELNSFAEYTHLVYEQK